MSSSGTRSFFVKAVTLAVFLAISCGSCKRSMPFDPSAPLHKKWEKVSSWVGGEHDYIVISDIAMLSGTDFFKNVFLKNTGKAMSLLKGFNVETDVGIAVFTGGLMYLGGRFDEDAVIQKIRSLLAEDNASLSIEGFKGWKIYTESPSGSSFVFLEDHLLCFGRTEDLRSLLANKRELTPPSAIDLTHAVWGRINKGRIIYPKMIDMTISADIDKDMELFATARFPEAIQARAFADEVEGIKTIKTIQSIDEPWLADLLDGITIRQKGDSVVLRTSVNSAMAKKILKKVGQ